MNINFSCGVDNVVFLSQKCSLDLTLLVVGVSLLKPDNSMLSVMLLFYVGQLDGVLCGALFGEK